MGLQHVAASKNMTQRLLEHAVTLALSTNPLLPLLTQNVFGLDIVEHAAGSTVGGTHICSSSEGHATPPPDAVLVTLAERIFWLVVASQLDQAFQVYPQSTMQHVSCSGSGQAWPSFLAASLIIGIRVLTSFKLAHAPSNGPQVYIQSTGQSRIPFDGHASPPPDAGANTLTVRVSFPVDVSQDDQTFQV